MEAHEKDSDTLLIAMAGPALTTAAETSVSPREKYILYCAGCHGFDGEGGGGGGGTKRITTLVPRVGAFLQDPAGRRYLINVGGVSSAGMTDAETATVLNYILTTFGAATLPKDFVPYTAAEVAAFRKHPVRDTLAMRRDIDLRLQARKVSLPPHHWEE